MLHPRNKRRSSVERLERRALFASVVPVVETTPVPHSGDAADDTAVWVHPNDPSLSVVIGTDKLGGIATYGLDGRQIVYRSQDGILNNVDIRYGFPLGGESVDLVVASNVTTGGLSVYRMDAATRALVPVAARTIATGFTDAVYGLCMYRSARTGRYYAFVSENNTGVHQQWELFDNGSGLVDAVKVRQFDVGAQHEGMVADDAYGALYLSEETVGVWRYGAEPDAGTDRVRIDTVGAGGHLTADVEGLSIYYAAGGAGYLIASSQGSHDYAVYDRRTEGYVGRFNLVDGGSVDGTSDTDGIDVLSYGLGPALPDGIFTAQDGSNAGGSAQNFKFARWGDVAAANGLIVDTTQNPRVAPAPLEGRTPPPASPSADHVILVSVDGLRPDAVTTLGPAQAPNFYRLRTEGAYTDNARTDHDYTITLPNHTTQITGRPVVGELGHNWVTNTDPLAGQTLHSNKNGYVASAWDVAHDRGLRTALYASKTKFSLYDTSYDDQSASLQGGAPDAYLADGDQTRDKIDTYGYHSDTAAMTDALVARMRSADPFDFAMVHFHDPDSAGHASGWMGTAYLDAVRRVDQQLGKILAAIDADPALKGLTAVILTADHGGEGNDHGTSSDPDMYTIPFYVWGAGVSAGSDLYALNGATRANPGTGRFDNAARPQPIRNGDAANLAMDFLDLPPVPGSLFNSGLDLSVAPAPPPQPAAATVVAPQDNGSFDLDPAAGSVRVAAQQGSFKVRLTDADGVNDGTVVPSALRMTRDGIAFTDYGFSYDAATDTVTLTPAGGASAFSYAVYELYLNDTSDKVRDGAGNALAGTKLRVHVDGSAVTPVTASFRQGVNGYGGNRDTMVLENSPTASSATVTSLKVDADEPSGTQRDAQALLRFDNVFGAGPGQVPAGAEVRSARLELQIINAGNALQLHRMLIGWEDTATWNSLGSGVQANGVEALAAAAATTPFVNVGLLSIDVSASLRVWQADPSRNFGWAILPTGGDGVNFDSAEGAAKPRLVVEYTTGSPPAAANDAYAVVEDTPLTVAAPGVLANDADPDGDALSAVLVSGPTRGTVTLNADGSFTYTPRADFHGVDSFTYRATRGGVQSNGATVTLEVSGAPDAPVARDDAFEVSEDGVLQVAAPGVLANDVDPDTESDLDHAAPLSAEVLDGPSHGTFTLNPDGSFVYEPDPNYWGPDGFTYRVSDGQDWSVPARVDLTVLPVNDDPPVARDDEAATREDTPVVIPVVANDTDGDGDGLAAVIVTGPASGEVTVNANGTVTYRPAPNFSGTDTFTYRASDGGAELSGIATVTVRVEAVNDAPTAVGDEVRGTEDGWISIDPAALLANDSDVEGDALTFVEFGSPSRGTLVRDEGSGLYVYTPAPDFFGNDTFTYTVADAAGATSTGTVTVAVEGTNDLLTVADDAASAFEDMPVTIDLLGNDSDPDGDALSVVSVSQPANGTVTVNADGTVTYTPAANLSGTDTFTYVASDGAVQSSPATVTVTVAAVNDAPAGAADSYAVDEDATLSVAAAGVLANDTDAEGQPLTAVLVTGPSHGTLTLNPDGSFTYVPAANYEGVDQFTYRASDGSALSAPVTVTITVRPMPEPPAAPASLKASNVTATSVSLTWQDRSADETGFVIEYSADNGKTWSKITVGANTRNYTVTGLTRNTTYRFRALAFNGAGNSAYSNTVNATTRR